MDTYIYQGGSEKQLKEALSAINGYDESFRYVKKVPPYGQIIIPKEIGKCWLRAYPAIWGWDIISN